MGGRRNYKVLWFIVQGPTDLGEPKSDWSVLKAGIKLVWKLAGARYRDVFQGIFYRTVRTNLFIVYGAHVKVDKSGSAPGLHERISRSSAKAPAANVESMQQKS